MSSFLNIDPVQAMLSQTSLQTTLFPSTSRYYGVETATLQRPGQRPIIYLRRRFVPPTSAFQVVEQHTVASGERPDHVASQFLGDPALFWRLCDANDIMRPEELTQTPGAKIDITLPDGVSGSAL